MKQDKFEKFLDVWCKPVGFILTIMLFVAACAFAMFFLINAWMAIEKVIDMKPTYDKTTSLTIASCDIKSTGEGENREWKMLNPAEVVVQFDGVGNVKSVLVVGEKGLKK